MHARSRLAAALLAALFGCATPAARSGPAADGEAPPRLELPPDVRPLRAALELTVRPAEAAFEGRIELEVELDRPRRRLWLHGRGLTVTSAEVEAGGRRLVAAWTQEDEEGLARLDLPAPIGPGRATVRLRWTGAWGQSAGLFRWEDRGDWYAATQLESIYARRAFPCFDEPARRIPWEVALVVPEGTAAISNMPEAAVTPAGPGLRRVRFATSPPLPSYLLFAGVGPFDVLEAALPPGALRPRTLRLRAFAPRGRSAEATFGLEATGALVPALERVLGVPFPYAKLDSVAVPGSGGGMENAGVIRYGDAAFLHLPGRDAEARRPHIASLVAHEIGHQWLGDLVGIRWWDDVWLKEAFATWIAPIAVDAWQPGWGFRLRPAHDAADAIDSDGRASARAVRQPLTSLAQVSDQYDALSYQKGAAVIGMFSRLAGEERARQGLRRYLEAHRDGAATAADFLAALSTAAGRDLAPAFRTFLDQPGVPLVVAAPGCGPAGAEVRLRQSSWHPRGAGAVPAGRWSVPVCVRGEAGGRPFERCTLLEAAEGTLPIPEGCPDWLLPNAGGVGYYVAALPAPDLARLLGPGLPRLTAAEKVSLLTSLRAADRAGALPHAALVEAAARLAADPDEEVGLAALQIFEEDRAVLAGEPALEALRGAVWTRLGPRFRALGWAPRPGEPEPAGRLRAALLEALALTGCDPAVRAEAVRRGSSYLGLDGAAADPAAVDLDLLGVTLAVTVEDRGAPAQAAVWRRYLDSPGPAQGRLERALFASADPALQSRAGGLWRERSLLPLSRGRLALAFAAPDEQAPAILARLQAELGEVLEALPEGWQSWSAWSLARLQEGGHGQAVHALFAPQLPKYPEMERSLAQVEEEVAIRAERRARRAEIGAAWEALARER